MQGYLQKYRVLYEEILDVKHRLEQINRKDREKEHLVDLLTYQIREIESAQLKPGEEEELTLRRDQIANAEKIIHLLSSSKRSWMGKKKQRALCSCSKS